MCKISVGYDLTDAVIENLTEGSERGAGIVAIKDGFVVYDVNVEGNEVRRRMRKELVGQCSFFLYHSRLPSVGTVSIVNTQPFFDKETGMAFGHNGTLNMLDILPLAIAANTVVDADWSDSKVLWETLRRVSPSMRKMLLSTLGGNYVWVDLGHEEVELYGTWRRQYGCARTTYAHGDRMVWDIKMPLDKTRVEAVPRYKEQASYSYGYSANHDSSKKDNSWFDKKSPAVDAVEQDFFADPRPMGTVVTHTGGSDGDSDSD